MTGPYVQYRVLEVKITGFFFLVTSCEENLVILNLLDPLAVRRTGQNPPYKTTLL